MLITGYIQSGDAIYFVYGNSYYTDSILSGHTLMLVRDELLNVSVSAHHDEPNAILYPTQ